MRKKLLFIVPPCVAISDLTPNENKTFSSKIRKEIPLGALSLATYMERYTNAEAVILDLNLKFYTLVNEGKIDQVNTAEKYIRHFISQIREDEFDFCGISAIFSPTFGYSKSLITREKLEKGFQCSFEFIKDLDEIPPLDFSLIEFGKYNSHAHSQVDREVVAMPLMFSRGCPFNCCFCASHSIHGKKVRYNSLQRIKSDIKLAVDKYQVNTITVWDDNFFVDKEQALILLDYFMELQLTVEFVNGFPVYRMDDDMARRLKMSGIDVVTLAIESGNPRILKEIIHKPLKLEMVPHAIACLNKYDIYVKGLFVIGFPGESLEDIQMTMDFIHTSDLNWVDIFIASPLPGSDLYDMCKAKGYLKNESLDTCNFLEGNIETEFFHAGQIEEIQVYNTIKKDFVCNLDMRNRKWERALVNFEYVIHAKHKNPFAYYYAAKAAKEIGLLEKAEVYYNAYQEIRKNSIEWEKVFQKFGREFIEFPEI